MRLRVIDASSAVGAGAVRNRGVEATDSPWLLFCDADDEVDAHWLASMASALRSGATLVAGPIDYRRLNEGLLRSWRGADQAFLHEPLRYLPAAHSANLGVTREVFERLGGFDEAFTGACEDIDFCWRAQETGETLLPVPNAVVHYRLRSCVRAVWRQSVAYAEGEARLFRKFRSAGARRRPTKAAIHDLWWLLTRAAFTFDPNRRGAWVRRLGQQVGRVQGSVQQRTIWW
jgi:GT2 family glycosyltransferase